MKRKYLVPVILLLLLCLCKIKHTVIPHFLQSDTMNPTISSFYDFARNIRKNTTSNSKDMLIAVLGSDEREDEKSRSDVLMLAKYKSADNKVIIVSIPRDSRVSIPGRGMSKINSAYAYGGAKLQVKILEKLFNVNNVRYIHFNFEGFTKIIDTIGGVKVTAQKDFRRDWGKMNTYAVKGENILLGDDLLEYVRFRHDEEGDFGRIKRQQEVLQSLYSKILSTGGISKLPKIVMLIAKNSDSDMNIFSIMRSIEQIGDLSLLKFEFHTLKTFSRKSDGVWYEIIDSENLSYISDLLQQ